MERLKLALERAFRAIATLNEVLSIEEATEIERDAAIQRFEYTFEAVVKAGRHYLQQIEGIDVASPKGIVRACREIGALSEQEAIQALGMTDDRNLTSHTYNRALALEIYGRLKGYATLLQDWVTRLEHRMAQIVESSEDSSNE